MPKRRQHRTLCATVAAAACIVSSAATAQPAGRLAPDAAVTDYCAAWGIADPAARGHLLARVFADDGVYSDPSPTLATGRAGLSNVIAGFQRSNPGALFRCSAPQTHHSFMRMSWTLVSRDGAPLMRGVDFIDLAPDGRIQRVVGFFGDPPAAPQG